ncbi:hypothetical protein BH20ACI3_BH20ACI3_24460 [soil metagenome]
MLRGAVTLIDAFSEEYAPAILKGTQTKVSGINSVNSFCEVVSLNSICTILICCYRGAAVVDIFKQAEINAVLRPILIHGGDSVVYEGGCWRVPKRELVGVAQVALQTGRLKIASELPEVGVLTQELQNFQVSISNSGFDSYEARTGKHDDLVLSLAMALWLSGRRRPQENVAYSYGYREYG